MCPTPFTPSELSLRFARMTTLRTESSPPSKLQAAVNLPPLTKPNFCHETMPPSNVRSGKSLF